jgi:hypothetical protein
VCGPSLQSGSREGRPKGRNRFLDQGHLSTPWQYHDMLKVLALSSISLSVCLSLPHTHAHKDTHTTLYSKETSALSMSSFLAYLYS